MARIFAELCVGQEPDLSSFNDDIKKEINRYFYLLNDVYIAGEAEGEMWLEDLIEFKKIDIIGKVKGHGISVLGFESTISRCNV